MPSFIAVIAVTPEGRIAKYAEFDNRPDANAHIAQFGGFVVPNNTAAISHIKIGGGNAVTVEAPPPPVIVESPDRLALRRLAGAIGVDITDLVGAP